MDNGNAIEVLGLRKSYGDVEVLKGVDLNVQRGTILALLGPNGAGKTTIVRTLSTLTRVTGGSASVNGYDVMTHSDQVRASIGLVSQFMALDYVHTGRENLVMLGRLHRIGTAAAKKRAAELLEQFDLVEAGDRPVKTYSGGMRRRLDLAISLITVPPVLFLDEPTVGLDPRSRRTMWDAIEEFRARGTTVFLTTQYLEEADELADRIAVIDQGRIVAEGTSAELKQDVGNERLEMGFRAAADFAKARDLAEGERVGCDEEAMTLSVSTDDMRYVISMMSRIEGAGLDIGSVSMSKPSLDDVFLSLTQRDSTEEEGVGAK
ncbi:ATP-binding cassette domain-containing protein [Streptomyces tendae]|uniref:ATP-binding cassette domain-containing protein n=1 Tax=Streptomyces tendae TaxID=1932 RepID=UPI0037218CF7